MPKKSKPSPKKKHVSPKKKIKSPKVLKPVLPTACTTYNKIIYLDNNATTLICPPAAKEFNRWLSCFNPASDSKIAQPARHAIEKAKEYILHHCNAEGSYTVIFTSGATESNCFMLKSTIEAYTAIQKAKPHIIISSIEHSSILDCCLLMRDENTISLTLVKPNVYGCILASDVEKAIQDDTALISIMFAQNEIGSINNVAEIAKVAHKHKIPFHSDAVQIFGKSKIDMKALELDAISVSFHKLYGPKGIGMVILNNDVITGYQLHGQISGHQQGGLRGGTENVGAVMASVEAMKWNFTNRKEKNKFMLCLRNYIIEELGKHIPWGDYLSYLSGTKKKEDLELILIGPSVDQTTSYLPNTLLISIVKNKGPKFCNIEFKKALDKKGVIVSIGSSCLTNSPNASHVLDAIDAPNVIKRGIIRISLGDYNTLDEIKRFCKVFLSCLPSL